MALYSSFSYGTGVFYGPSSALGSISPETGPNTGGADYIITGSGFEITTYDDDFSAGSLDLTKWVSLDSGSGSLTTSPNLQLSTGSTAGSFSGVESVQSFGSAQFGIKTFINRITSYPTSTVELLSYVFYVDSNNYCKISIQVGSTAETLKMLCEVYVNSALVDSYTEDWSVGYSTFKIARFDSTVYFLANGELIFQSRRFITTSAKFRIYSYNGSASYDVRTLVDYFSEKTYVMFGTQIDPDPVVVSESRVRGVTPPSIDGKDQLGAFKGTVDVYVINSLNTAYGADLYEYYYVNKFKTLRSNQDDLTLSLVDDDQLITPDTKDRGL
jgi:hypothetical protein